MKWNKNLIIYIYDATKDTQKAALHTLSRLQHYEVREFDIGHQHSKKAACELLGTLAVSNEDQVVLRNHLMSKLKNGTEDIDTPIMVTSEKIIYVKEDGSGTFQNELSQLDVDH